MSILVTELAVEAQINVLGSMPIDQETVSPLLHRLTAEDFIEGRYRNIFQAIKKLQSQGKDPDPLLVNDTLGGNYPKILAGLMECTPTSANAMEYAAILHRAALQYRLAELGEQLTAAASSGLDEARTVADKITALACEKPGVRITDSVSAAGPDGDCPEPEGRGGADPAGRADRRGSLVPDLHGPDP